MYFITYISWKAGGSWGGSEIVYEYFIFEGEPLFSMLYSVQAVHTNIDD
jgi:hypothetical protein